ncbi:MAG: hypothetical protein V3U96_11410 [Paracoccaceae bacterium]
MRPGIIKTLQATVTAVTAASFSVAVANAQAEISPVSVNLTFASNLSLDTNPTLSAVSAGSVFRASEDVGLHFMSETSTQIFQFSVATGLALSKTVGGGTSTSFSDPQYSLRYTRNAANANLDLSAAYTSGAVSSSFDIDPTSAVFIIVDTGTLDTSDAAIAYNWGLNAPLGFSVSASYAGRTYSGTTNPALFNTVSTVLSAGANLRISPATQGTLTATVTDYSASDAFSTNRSTRDLGFNVTHDLARGLTIDGAVGFRTVATTASGTTTTDQGLMGGVNLTQALANGTIYGGIQADGTGASTATSLTFGRSLELPDGSLSASLTADITAGAAPQILGSLSYLKQLPDGSISVDASQSLTTDSLSQDVKASTIAIAYQKDLNSDSGLSLSFDISRVEDSGAGVADTLNRATLTATYSRALTQDWGMSVGYSHRQNSGSAIATASSDRVFLTLTRDLQFGF